MTTTGVSDAAPAEAIQPKPKPFSRMLGVLFSPVETMREIARTPDVLVPLIMAMLIGTATTFATAPHIDYAAPMREAMQRQDREPTAGQLQWAEGTKRVAPFIAGPMTAISFAAIAGVLLFAFRAFGGEGTFKQAYSVATYAWIPMLLYGIIVAIVLAVQGSVVGPDELPTVLLSSPGFFLDRTAHPMLFAILTSIEVFRLWTVALLAIGFMFLSGLSRGASIAILASIYGVVILFKLAGAALSTMGGPA